MSLCGNIKQWTLTIMPVIQFIGVSSGSDHTLAITKGGDVYACGKGGDGQLGMCMYI